MTEIFLSYAREDQQFVELLKPVLRRLQEELQVSFFHDLEHIHPGEQWDTQISDALEKASLVICFVSNHFFSSTFIQHDELPLITRRFGAGLQVVPILIEPVLILEDSIFSKVQWLNNEERTLSRMTEAERSLFVVEFEKNLRIILKNKPLPVKPPKVRYNLAVVGKAGVGKSELINYLFAKDILPTGIGKPITPIGFHRQDFTVAGVPASLWDSAGLEVGQHHEWMRTLNEELNDRGPTQPVEKWFHTVLYCVQATGARIEPFEMQIINKFLKDRYKVIIVITKAFISKRKVDELAMAIQQGISRPLTCVHVNSRDEEIGDIVIHRFGRAVLIREIEIALIESLTERIPARCIAFMSTYVDEKCEELCDYVREKTGQVRKNQISEEVTRRLKNLLNEVRAPQGQFRQIVRRETRYTLGVYKEIAGIVEQAMALAEEAGPITNVPSEVLVPRVGKFWGHVEENFSQLYEWELSQYIGDVGEMLAIIAFAPIAGALALLGGTWDAVEEHLKYRDQILEKIKDYNERIKDELWKSEDNIKRLFSDRIRQISGS